jgi:hypothetical protein
MNANGSGMAKEGLGLGWKKPAKKPNAPKEKSPRKP